MEPIAPNGSAAAQRVVDRPRDAYRETLDTTRERGAVVRLYQHVHVIGLDAGLQQAKGVLGRGGESGTNGRKDMLLAQ
jgi:hypothetical protein